MDRKATDHFLQENKSIPRFGISNSRPGGWLSGFRTLLIVVTAMAAAPSWATWVAQDSSTRENLIAVQFPVDANTGFVVGRGGVILNTTNGGASWKKNPSGTKNNLLAVHFPRTNTTGYAVGVNGTILKTTNGGSTWTSQSSEPPAIFRAYISPSTPIPATSSVLTAQS